jgi:hypothetical protein
MVKAAANAPPLDTPTIAEQALHHRAGHSQQRADHCRDGDARNTDRPQHELVAGEGRGVSGAAKAERRPQPGQWNAGGAHGRRKQRRTDEQRQQRGEHREGFWAALGGDSSCGRSGHGNLGGAHCRQFTDNALALPIVSCPAIAG